LRHMPLAKFHGECKKRQGTTLQSALKVNETNSLLNVLYKLC
jgi:hypothetical protein